MSGGLAWACATETLFGPGFPRLFAAGLRRAMAAVGFACFSLFRADLQGISSHLAVPGASR